MSAPRPLPRPDLAMSAEATGTASLTQTATIWVVVQFESQSRTSLRPVEYHFVIAAWRAKDAQCPNMKRIAVIGSIMFACLFASVLDAATTAATRHSTKIHVCRTCTGSDPCNACKNCNYCKHCAKEGGTCGVCKR